MSNGIYYYYDKKKNSVVYVGKDSYIDKNKRHKAHMAKCNYDNQSFNSILQNNPDRYEYRIYCEGIFSNEELNNLEIQTIKLFDTLHREDAYNYTEGGDGVGSGENHPKWKDYARVVKKGIYPNGKQRYVLRYNGEDLVYSINKEELKEVADRINKLENKDEETVNQIIKEYKANKKNYATVIKYGITPNGKQNYALRYNGKILIQSINKKELEELADRINKLENKDDETVKQIIEEYKARKKDYARVVKKGTTPNGKQKYALKQNGEIITTSIYKEKLEKEAEDRNKKLFFYNYFLYITMT